MSAKQLLERCYSQNGNIAQDAQSEHTGLVTGVISCSLKGDKDPFSSGICDCEGGDCCSPGRSS